MRSAKESDPRQRLALRLEKDIDKPSTESTKDLQVLMGTGYEKVSSSRKLAMECLSHSGARRA
jgi:hypothetical protein